MFMALRRNLKTISNCISAKQIKLDFYFENVNRLMLEGSFFQKFKHINTCLSDFGKSSLCRFCSEHIFLPIMMKPKYSSDICVCKG